MRRTLCRNVCIAESTTESHSAISNAFHKAVEKRNPYKSKNRRPKPTSASLFCPP